MKNPEGDGSIVEANFVWILRYAQNDSLFCREDSLSCQAQGSESTPFKPKIGLSGPPATLLLRIQNRSVLAAVYANWTRPLMIKL